MKTNNKKNKPREKGQFLRVLKTMFKYNPWQVILIPFLIIISGAALVVGNYLLQPLIDDVIKPAMTNPINFESKLISFLLVMGAFYLAGVIASFLFQFLVVKVAQKTILKIRNEAFEKLQYLSVSYFDKSKKGDIMSRFTNDTEMLRNAISTSIPGLISSIVQITIAGVALVMSSWQLSLISIFSLIIIMFVIGKIGKKIGTKFKLQQEELGKINGFMEEIINGQKVVKVFNYEKRALDDFKQRNEEFRKVATKAQGLGNIMMPLVFNMGLIQYAIVAIIAGVLAIKGLIPMSVGTITSFLMLSRNFTNPLMQVADQISMMFMGLNASKRVFEITDMTPEQDFGKVSLVNYDIDDNGNFVESNNHENWAWKKDNNYIPLKGDIVLSDVTFSYVENKNVLKHIDVYAHAGQKVAFVGKTGAGKTTITNLINRFYEINSGSITYDGIDIKEIKKSDLRRSLGIVLQDTNLFTGTVRENIKYSMPNASDEEMINAAKLANAHTFIKRLPQGYDTILTSNGDGLSQGQRQLISIARATLYDAPVMVLDEATSSIDSRTEVLVQKGTDRLMQNRTVFVIAHRLSTIQNSDAIMLLKDGNIIERGNHNSLIDKKGEYYKLYTSSFE